MTRGHSYAYFTNKWRDNQRGFAFDHGASGWFRIKEFHSCTDLLSVASILIPLDPLTAIGLGLVTPEELNLPEGLQAAFNLLK
jgi:hypothetical protein